MSVAHPTAGPAFVNSPGIARSADDARRPIAPVLPPGNFGSGTVDAVIATGLYFKREWAAAIDTSLAVSGPFTLCDGTQVLTSVMHRTGPYAYARGIDSQTVQLPFSRDNLSMVIALPDPGVNLNDFVATITAEQVKKWIDQLQFRQGQLALPWVMSTFGDSQPALCRSLGVKASAEAFPTGGESAWNPGAVTLALDRPFFYAIRDDSTEELIFIGTLVDPG